jgi:uncharacterized protein (DUF885 family)
LSLPCRRLPVLLAGLLLFATHAVRAADVPSAAAQTKADDALGSLLAEAWEHSLASDPLFATQTGDNRYNGKLPAVGLADHEQRLAAEHKFFSRLQGIDRNALSPQRRVDYDLYRRLTEDTIAEYGFRSHLMPITNREGFHVEFPELDKSVPLVTTKDYENYIARLRGFLPYARQHIELLREGLKTGIVLPEVSLRGYEDIIEPHLVSDPKQSRLYDSLESLPETVPESEHARLQAEAARAIAESVVPGYREFYEFLKKDYLPAARGTIGAAGLPNGREFYRHRVRKYTTLDVTPEQVHQTGLAEVARIRKEMEEVVKKAGFQGTREQFVEHLRSDPKFYAKTPEELLEKVAFALKKADGKLPELFGALPRMPYGIRPVPDFIAPQTTTAYYMGPAGDGTRAGFYYVNTYDLKSRPLYEVEALSLHEAVPGHHLQIALQQELGKLAPFRRFAGVTAFIEGWGLYAEKLGQEMDFYQDPYSDFGRLSYEMWRACRLVVDPGMHALGWTRQQAIDFMAANTALSQHNIVAEVDRYISWPGQAVAYKMGELKIRELRARAEKELGDRFDVRKFHDAVLGSGAVPLDVLEQQVEDYIRATKQAE